MLHRDFAHLDHFTLRVFLMRKGHGDHVARCALVDACQQRACQDAVIIAATSNKVCKDHPVDEPMRMVRDKHNGAFSGNAIDLFLRGLQLDPHGFHGCRPKCLTRWSAKTFELLNTLDDRDLARQPFDRPDKVTL